MAEFEIIGRNDDRIGMVVVGFMDGSSVRLEWFGVQVDEGAELSRFPAATWSRQVYRYVVTDAARHVLADGEDLRSGCGEPINLLEALVSWTSFALADAEAYRANMSGTAFEEWAYMHDEELQYLSISAQ